MVKMYAVVCESIVIDCVIEKNKIAVSPLTNKQYKNSDNIKLIEMIEANSPAEIGFYYDETNNKFNER
jgi:hypothetical protein